MKSEVRFDLTPDRKGVIWDLLLYIPTVVALLSMAAKFWYSKDDNTASLFVFLASFFFIVGANRVLKTRLMLLPSSPVAIEIDNISTRFILRNGKVIELIKDIKYYSDYSGRTFGVAGMDKADQRLQFVFHKGQFLSPQDYQGIQDRLRK
ncbi:MAG: hypothetical protein V4443_03665 [Pseudomonadota bacterium]